MSEKRNKVVIYQTKNGSMKVRLDKKMETIMLTQQQVGQLFEVQKAAISKHIKNIFIDGELDEKSTVSILETVQIEGKRKISRKVEYYNLDLILSIGYRVNSAKATKFRQWSTKTLRRYILDGFVINKAEVAKNYKQFMSTVENIKHLLPSGAKIDNAAVLELISTFADTWMSLEAYDKDTLVARGKNKKIVSLNAENLIDALANFKRELLKKGEATEFFGQEKQRCSIEGIIGNVMQTFAGKYLYSTVEEKAAHPLCFMVKDHPFIDGNKRNGAYAFVCF